MGPDGSSGRPKVASEPEALVRFFGQLDLVVTRIGLKAGPLSQWLHAGLTKAGLEVVLLETRQVKAALSVMVVKTDRKDARGIVQLLRMRLVSAGALQVAARPGGSGAAGRAQALAGQALGCRAEHPEHPVQPSLAGLVGVLRLWYPSVGVPGDRQPRLRPGPSLPGSASQGALARHQPLPREAVFGALGVLHRRVPCDEASRKAGCGRSACPV